MKYSLLMILVLSFLGSCRSPSVNRKGATAKLSSSGEMSISADISAELQNTSIQANFSNGFYAHKGGLSGSWFENKVRAYPAFDRRAGFAKNNYQGRGKDFLDARENMINAQYISINNDQVGGLVLFESMYKNASGLTWSEFLKSQYIIEIIYFRSSFALDYKVAKAKFYLTPNMLLNKQRGTKPTILLPFKQIRFSSDQEAKMSGIQLEILK